MKVFALFVVALLAASFIVVPAPSEPVPDPPPAMAAAPFAVCPLGEAAQRDTVVDVVGGEAGEVDLSVFSAGTVVAREALTIPDTGVATLELAEITGVALAPTIVALDDPDRAVGSVLRGAGVAAAACDSGSLDPSVLAGGSTVQGETYRVVLANPFAGTARVDLLAASEIGTESDPALEGIVIPPRSIISIDVGSLLPGRQSLSVAVNTSAGRVISGAVQEGGGDVSAIQGLSADVDWFLLLPDFPELTRSLVLMAPGTADVPFQLDVYGAEGLVEAMYEETVPARGQTVVAVDDLLEGPGVVRVVAAGPVGAALRLHGEAVRAVTPGVPVPALSWLLPGAGDLGPTRVLVFNPGAIDVTARLTGAAGGEVDAVDVPSGQLVTVPLPEGRGGARLEADGEVVVTWVTATAEGVAGDAGRAAG